MNAVHTNLFVYAFDADEAVKRPKAEELLDRLAQQSGETVLLWQVAAEFLNCQRNERGQPLGLAPFLRQIPLAFVRATRENEPNSTGGPGYVGRNAHHVESAVEGHAVLCGP